MNPLTPSEKEKILSRLFWDIKMDQMDLEKLIDQKIKTIEDIHSQQFFSKLLTSCDWYTLIKLMPPAKLKMILSEPILNRLFPRNLKQKYAYARDVLSQRTISYSGQDT